MYDLPWMEWEDDDPVFINTPRVRFSDNVILKQEMWEDTNDQPLSHSRRFSRESKKNQGINCIRADEQSYGFGQCDLPRNS